ncbi:hypothetical protein [Aquibacillus albus]|uniref:Imidazoleglycerol-phosphate dehydratase n=1 Tax=Aquibacillus albus TaxID=1168171 RepID=A0ABS2MV67_9BACI|nr:hypothetical protein [Aquibacillus albus]MBM7569742.1 hypothetical protein [Aquibacillus albus]
MGKNKSNTQKAKKDFDYKRDDHGFSEELSDGGERDKIIKQQSSKSCGGL